MKSDRLEELADKLETWLTAVKIHPYRQNTIVLRENLDEVNGDRYGPLIADYQQELAALNYADLKLVV